MKNASELEQLVWYYLHRGDMHDFEQVIFEAVSSYLQNIIDKIPYKYWDEVDVFLTQEAWEILRQMTYGYESLREFHQKRLKQ